ncbi:MAG: winged helix-turn-helix domain-containing protein [Candidatus Bathyarchaeia archaeon]
MVKRGRVDIYAEILEAVSRRGSMPITKIGYASGLPLDRTRKLLNILISYGLIKEELGERPQFIVTKRGFEFLDAYRKMRAFLNILSEGLT